MKKLLFICYLLSTGLAAKAELVWFDGKHAITYQMPDKVEPVVTTALEMWKNDMLMVTGMKPVAHKQAVVKLTRNNNLGDDAFCIYTKGKQIVIEAANGRGMAYGLLELSRMAGVSPWVWWGDIVPERKAKLALSDDFKTKQQPSVAYRGIFINDEDWSLRPWSCQTYEPTGKKEIGTKTYRRVFELLLRLRANTIWPAMHPGTTAFFKLPGAKAVADSCGIVIGSSHCEPLLRNNVDEWDAKQRGAFNYRTNRQNVHQYWTERLQQVKHSKDNMFTIGMRGIHDSSMEGYKTDKEKLQGLQLVIDNQQQLLQQHIGNPQQLMQVFVPYKEVLHLYEKGLKVPDYVTLMWCDDNYGYMTRLSNSQEQLRQGGAGVYYHLSYWGRPHDYLWLTTTQPGLIYNEMSEAYRHNVRKLWIANVHDPKVAGYDLELFLDMAWNIDCVDGTTLNKHYEAWLCRQFGTQAGRQLLPVMLDFYRLCGERRPEFMGYTQVELDGRKYHRGLSEVTDIPLSQQQANERLAAFERLKQRIREIRPLIAERLADAFFAAIEYPVFATAAMNTKILGSTPQCGWAYDEIQALTKRYNEMNGGKWRHLMDAAPRRLPVFENVNGQLTGRDEPSKQVLNAAAYQKATNGVRTIQMLGHSMQALALPKGGCATYELNLDAEGDYLIGAMLIPTQPNDNGDLRFSMQLDNNKPVVFSLKEPFRSEQWKQNVLNGQAVRQLKAKLTRGAHVLTLKALDAHVVLDQISYQKTNTSLVASALDQKRFDKFWQVESEAPDYQLRFMGDTCEMVAPKGLTLWRKDKLQQGTTIEYDACVMDEGKQGDRLSDMNCFWMASDPKAKSIWTRADWRQGVFTRCYSLQMYYLGYGGNYNATTRFRRYNGDEAGIDDATKRPAILKEYTDPAHLLKPNHWYHIKLESTLTGRTRMWIDGVCVVDYLDPQPLKAGWFGFRTTLSRTRIANYQQYATPALAYNTTGVPLHWIGGRPEQAKPVSFGVPFAQGELKDVSTLTLADGTPADAWVNATWPDGSVKWAGLAAVIPAGCNQLWLQKGKAAHQGRKAPLATNEAERIVVNTGALRVSIAKQGEHLIDSMWLNGKQLAGAATLIAQTNGADYTSQLTNVQLERAGSVSAVVKAEGVHVSKAGRAWLPFTVRLYFYAGSEQVRLVHTFTYDGQPEKDQIKAIGLRLQVPMREAAYNRHVAFATEQGIWAEPVQPLDGRRTLVINGDRKRNLQAEQMAGKRIPDYSEFDRNNARLLDHWAQWDEYRLSQLTDNAWSIRKRATNVSPWIGTRTGTHGSGFAFVGDVSGGIGAHLKDFWQSYPSTIEVTKARSKAAELTMWLWSPEAEPMNLCHYDTIAHDLLASYEDVQPGMSTPYGIARTSTMTLTAFDRYPGREALDVYAKELEADNHLLPTPQYLHEKRAFGIWSLPKDSTDAVEQRLARYIDAYKGYIAQYKWYGFWNYGDLMHTYDEERQEWRYDVGGFAWDNTELATPMWLWYNFLRTGRADIWRMAEAMTRHCSEVDTYHIGPFAPLGSRHNVSHWGCGAKEARISQAAFNRFYYYLTTDERTGDLMREQRDADTLLYHLDPMRLAEPRSKYPCNAPARLRIGPDWLAYAGNWMTEWERFGTPYYYNKIQTGLQSIADLPDGIFTGNLAKGYDPATGRITYDGNPSVRSTNHLMTIMGGFELMNELMPLTNNLAFEKTWMDFARRYKQMAWKVNHHSFPVRRLEALAAWHDRDPKRTADTWKALWQQGDNTSNTNNAALWSLDAIYMQEVLNK